MAFWNDLWGDLKHSRRFQVWAILWVIFGVVIFIALLQIGTLEHLDDTDPRFKTWRVWEESTRSIAWPEFRVSVADPNLQFTNASNVVCYTKDNEQIQTSLILNLKDRTNYIMIHSSSLTASPVLNSVQCTVDTIARTYTIWEFLSPSSSDSNDQTIYVDTGSYSRIVIKKSAFEDKSAVVYRLDWHPTVTVVENSNPMVYITITDFVVSHYKEYDWYTGWQCFGDIGGITFMMYCIHSLAIFLLGPCLPNDSVIFKGQRSYDEIR